MRAAGEATRQRVLVEARREFAEHGLAGARVNRIAARAKASKERLYAYFPNKEELFAAVCAELVGEVADATHFGADDVPGYVGRLFDLYVSQPEALQLRERLALEGGARSQALAPVLDGVFGPKVDEVRRGQQAGLIDPGWEPVELLVLLVDMARLAASEHGWRRQLERLGHPTTLARRRSMAVRAAEQLVRPGPPPAAG